MTEFLEVRIDAASAIALFQYGANRLYYAGVNTVNNLAKLVQSTERQQAEAHGFIIRKEFVRRQLAIIDPFANVAAGRFSATVSVGQRERLLLPGFEAGFERKPFTAGATHVAIPILGRPARPSLRTGIPPAYTFAGLKFSAYRAGKKLRRRRRGRTVDVGLMGEYGRVGLPQPDSKIVWKGAQRTYIVPDVGVFQRIGSARGDTRLIWAFVRPFRVPAELRFVETARTTVEIHGARELQKEVEAVLAYQAARGH